jgi:hypothetical protein
VDSSKETQKTSKRIFQFNFVLYFFFEPQKREEEEKHHHERVGERKKKSTKTQDEKKNQKNFNSFIHSINIILDMVFLCTLYIFKGTHTRLMDCGVKKVCEGLKHRMVRASSTVRCFLAGAASTVRANKWEPKKKRTQAKANRLVECTDFC